MRMGMFNITRFACQTNPRRNSAPVSKPLIADSITAWCKAATASVLALLLAVVAAHQLLNHSESIFAAARPQASAAETLRKYVELRLHNADWKDYSRLVAWPDEPGWDCNWVVDKYSVGTERKTLRKYAFGWSVRAATRAANTAALARSEVSKFHASNSDAINERRCSRLLNSPDKRIAIAA